MKTSTEIGSTSCLIGEEKAVELVAKAGFDHWDFSMGNMYGYDWEKKIHVKTDHILCVGDYLGFARKLKQIGLDNGITCNQSHAPYPTYSMDIRPYLKRAIECTAEAGGNICVIHPANDFTPEQNAEMYFDLLPFAKECGVKIATENMWNWDYEKDQSAPAACSSSENFVAHMNAVNDDFFVACLDVGHAEMIGSGSGAANMIRALGKHVQALHIHDVDKHDDNHDIPFSQNIDFEEVVRALKDIDYKGIFTLEASGFMRKHTAENAFEGLKDLYKSVRKLADMFENM